MTILRKLSGKYHAVCVTDSIEPRIEFVNTLTGEKIPEDEPLFLLRARDNRAVPALCTYQNMIEGLAGNTPCTPEHQKGVDEAIVKFIEFSVEHPERMKEPGSSFRTRKV